MFKPRNFHEFTREELRYHAYRELKFMRTNAIISNQEAVEEPKKLVSVGAATNCYDAATTIKGGVHFTLYCQTIINLGKTLKILVYRHRKAQISPSKRYEHG